MKNPEMDLHFGGTKPPRPDSAGARPDTPPIPAGRRGDDAYRTGEIQNENENGNENEFSLVSSSEFLGEYQFAPTDLPCSFWVNINS
jgi:hypothetical protein